MSVGRPREFDAAEALDRALAVFWSKGYEGTTLPDLTAAMGINRPSLYAAFGNKEALFRRAIDRYVAGPASHVRQALARPQAKDAVRTLWKETIRLVTSPGNPRGCFLVQGALACGDQGQSVRAAVSRMRQASETMIRNRLAQAVRERDLPAEVDAADLARFVATVSQGLAVQAASGATRKQLEKVAALALGAWPG
jgi:AcrR family transcriptional regulator